MGRTTSFVGLSAYARAVRRPLAGVEMNFGIVGMLLATIVVLVAMVARVFTFADLAGIGLMYAAGVGLICAAERGGVRPRFSDPANIRNHWRGHLQIAAGLILFGLVGAGATALLR